MQKLNDLKDNQNALEQQLKQFQEELKDAITDKQMLEQDKQNLLSKLNQLNNNPDSCQKEVKELQEKFLSSWNWSWLSQSRP